MLPDGAMNELPHCSLKTIEAIARVGGRLWFRHAGVPGHIGRSGRCQIGSVSCHAEVCDVRASQSLGLRSSWHRYGISHLALAGLLADVVGVELADACIISRAR